MRRSDVSKIEIASQESPITNKMIRLFNTEFPTADRDVITVALLTAVSDFQACLSRVTGEVEGRVMSGFHQEETLQARHARWATCRVTRAQYETLLPALECVATALTLAIDTDMDFNQRFVTTCFNNTIADVLIQSIYDNTILSEDPLVRLLMETWEDRVIIPLFEHLIDTKNLALLNNETLIGEAATMERWARFEGDPKRGMFQTLGSALSKGFYHALQMVIDTNDRRLQIPSSFLGNLVGWGLHATRSTDRAAIMNLFAALLVNEYYRPSKGVYATVRAYVPGKIRTVEVDLIRDYQIGVMPDLRDVAPPADLAWQTRLLTAASVTLDQKVPFIGTQAPPPSQVGPVTQPQRQPQPQPQPQR